MPIKVDNLRSFNLGRVVFYVNRKWQIVELIRDNLSCEMGSA